MKQIYFLFVILFPLFTYSQIDSPAMDVSFECDGSGNTDDINNWLASNGGAEASTECGAVTWTNDFNGFSDDCYSINTVNFTATGDCGTATTTAFFTIEDVSYPIITKLSDDMTVICDGSGNIAQLNAWVLSNGGAEGYDNCSETYWTNDFFELSSDCSQTVSVEVLFTITDECGNEEYTYSTFTIEAPISDCPFIPIVLSSQADVDDFTTNYPNCKQLNDSLTISGVDIVDLMPLAGITSIKEGLIIENNIILTSLEGLNSLVFLDMVLKINDNPLLRNISALGNVSTAPASSYFPIYISNNPNLSECNIIPFCASISSYYADGASNSNYVIENNAENCNSIAQVSNACGLIPSNDDCEGALNLIIGENQEAYNEMTSISPQTPSCSDTNRVDVWFKFNSGNLTTVSIDVDADYSMQLWRGTCSSLTQVANACASSSLTDIPVMANTEYYLQVWSSGTGRRATGLFNILVQDSSLSVEESVFEGLSIYPNPVTNMLNLKSTKIIDSLEVYNLLGQQVFSAEQKSDEASLDMSAFPTGLYILRVSKGNQMETYKIIKE